MAVCPNCATVAAGKFCPNCGAQVPEQPPVASAAQTQQYPPQPPQGYAPQQYPQQPPQGFQPQYPPQQPGYGGYPQMPPQKPSSPWKWVGIIGGGLVVLVVAVLVLLSALGDDPGALPADKSVQVTTSAIKTVPVITSKVNEETQAPQGELKTVPPSTDMIYAAMQVAVKNGDVLSAKWFYNGKQQTHLDTELPVDEDFVGWAAFNISNGGKPWPAATYKFEVYLNGKKAQEKTFEVK